VNDIEMKEQNATEDRFLEAQATQGLLQNAINFVIGLFEQEIRSLMNKYNSPKEDL
jgi:hypothetical protein